MPPVAFIVAAVGLLVFWVVIVPLLVAINIQSLSTVLKKVRAEERQNLGQSNGKPVSMAAMAVLSQENKQACWQGVPPNFPRARAHRLLSSARVQLQEPSALGSTGELLAFRGPEVIDPVLRFVADAGYEVIGRTKEWMENNLFFCTPDPKDHSIMDEVH